MSLQDMLNYTPVFENILNNLPINEILKLRILNSSFKRDSDIYVKNHRELNIKLDERTIQVYKCAQNKVYKCNSVVFDNIDSLDAYSEDISNIILECTTITLNDCEMSSHAIFEYLSKNQKLETLSINLDNDNPILPHSPIENLTNLSIKLPCSFHAEVNALFSSISIHKNLKTLGLTAYRLMQLEDLEEFRAKKYENLCITWTGAIANGNIEVLFRSLRRYFYGKLFLLVDRQNYNLYKVDIDSLEKTETKIF